jgi:L-ascorbate metabolism protein UlaG (beta-lactamase superfamily)
MRASTVTFAAAILFGCAGAQAQTVKITPLGSHTGELCATDRALVLEDPSGVRILYDAGQAVAGGTDARLGEIHAVLLTHAHGDHIGDLKLARVGGGTCAQPELVSAAPHSNTAEIAAAKNAVLLLSNDMSAFLARKIEVLRGAPTPACATAGLGRETTVPVAAPCTANLQLGGKRSVRIAGRPAVTVALVQADHSNNAPRSLLTEPQRSSLAPDALSAYVGHANGYVITFSNGLKMYLSGDTALMGDMRTIFQEYYRVNLAVLNMGSFAMQSEEAAHAADQLLQVRTVLPSHVNEAGTSGGRPVPGSRTEQFVRLTQRAKVHLPLSGRTMEFDGNANCVAGC